MSHPGSRRDFSPARRSDGRIRRAVLRSHVGLCPGCGVYAAAVEDPLAVLAALTPVPLPGNLQAWGRQGVLRAIAQPP
jgi:hypothetical protein